MNKIVFYNKELIATDIQLPCFIHGYDGAGASQFTISLAANLVALERKVIFFCAYSQGRDSLLTELGNHNSDNVVIIEPGSESGFLDAINRGESFDYVVVKNIESHSSKVLEAVVGMQNTILSGDFDKAGHIENFQLARSKILFSPCVRLEPLSHLPPLEKYEGYLINGAEKGRIRLQIV